jgi:pyridoxine/pyridoxamine 5'-phosphate oxidase
MRREYRDSARVELNDAEIGTDPLPLFQKWLEEVGRLGLHFTPLRLKYVYAATGH